MPQAPKREEFEVTAQPFLRLPDELMYWHGKLAGDAIRGVGEPGWLPLTGQEFLLFSGIGSPPDVEMFAREHGLLTLPTDNVNATSETGVPPRKPLWTQLLTRGEEAYEGWEEPVEDWIPQAGLMSIGLSLIGLHAQPSARQSLAAAVRRRAGARSDQPWPTRYFLDGAARAGLSVLELQEAHGVQAVHLRGARFRKKPRPSPVSWHVVLKPAGIAEALAGLLNPWVATMRMGISARALAPTQRLYPSLLVIMWLQLANAVWSSVKPRLCAWERCPGPPARPGVFLWRWGQGRIKHRDSIYCHPKCQHAAAVAASRNSPGARRKR